MQWSNGLFVFGHVVIQILCSGESHLREEFVQAVGIFILARLIYSQEY